MYIEVELVHAEKYNLIVKIINGDCEIHLTLLRILEANGKNFYHNVSVHDEFLVPITYAEAVVKELK